MAMVRCMNCMEEYNEKQNKCPHCGYMNLQPEDALGQLPQETTLQRRYIVGNVLRHNEHEIIYIGWDQILEKSIAIKEFFPADCVFREKGQKEVFSGSEEEKAQFLRGLEQFISEAQQLARFREETGMLRIYDSFEENGTAYTIIEYTESLRTSVVTEEPKPVDKWQQMKKIFYVGWGVGAFAIMMLLVLILLEVRSGMDKVADGTIPNMIGMSYSQAEKELEAIGVGIEREKYCYSETVEVDVIMCQSIPKGTQIESGMVLRVVVTGTQKEEATDEEVKEKDSSEATTEKEVTTEANTEEDATEEVTTQATTASTTEATTTGHTVKKTTQSTREKSTQKKTEKKTTEKKTEKKKEQEKTTEKAATEQPAAEEVIVIEE